MRRRLMILSIALPVAAVVALLVWGTFRTGGRQGRPGINDRFGEVSVQARAAADFELETFTGGKVRLSDLRGKIVMIDFWASWCPPCRKEAPVLASVYRAFRDRPVEFVGVDIWDTEEGARRYIRDFGIEFPSGLDKNGRIAVDYGIRGIPEKFIVDQDGIVRRKFIGPMDRAKLEQALLQYLEPLEQAQLQNMLRGN